MDPTHKADIERTGRTWRRRAERQERDRLREMPGEDDTTAVAAAGGDGSLKAMLKEVMEAVFGQDPTDNVALRAMIRAQVATQVNTAMGAASTGSSSKFMVNPAMAGTTPWDLGTATGLKICPSAVAPLHVMFDGTADKLKGFLRQVYNRCETFGITEILCIVGADSKKRDLTKEFGALTRAQVHTAAILDMSADTRNHQAQEILQKVTMSSIEMSVLDRLLNRKDDHTVKIPDASVTPAVNIPKQPGTCILCELIDLISVHARATVASLMRKLDDLEKVMQESNSNIEKFNTTVESICDALLSKDAKPPELLIKLFIGCLACEDAKFRDYIDRKKESHFDGSLALDDKKFMNMALDHFKIRCYDEKNWMKKTQQELDFIAMQTQLNNIRTRRGGRGNGGNGNDDRNNDNETDANNDNENNQRRRRTPRGHWAWKGVAPKAGEPRAKTFDGKECIYCPHHQTTKWVLKTDRQGLDHATHCQARVQAEAANASTNNDSNNESQQSQQRRNRQVALQAATDADDERNDEDAETVESF